MQFSKESLFIDIGMYTENVFVGKKTSHKIQTPVVLNEYLRLQRLDSRNPGHLHRGDRCLDETLQRCLPQRQLSEVRGVDHAR